MTAFDLKPTYGAKAIVADGRLIEDHETQGYKWSINDSSILTKLIQETGRFAERFASDLFIDWRDVEHFIATGDTESKTWFFGIRECGVDHDSFINSRMANSKQYWKYEYRKIYRLDAFVKEEDYAISWNGMKAHDLRLVLTEVG